MFVLVKPDLRAFTKLLSVAAAPRRSPLAAAASCSSPLLLDLDADGTCPHPRPTWPHTVVVDRSSPLPASSCADVVEHIFPLPTSSYTVVVNRSSPLPAVPRCALILPLASCRTLLPLLLLHATAAARRSCCLPCCARCCLLCCDRCYSPCVQQAAAALGACSELCCSLLEFSPHARGTYIWQGRKTKDVSRSVICAVT